MTQNKGYMREFKVQVFTKKPWSEKDVQDTTPEVLQAVWDFAQECYLGPVTNAAIRVEVQGECDDVPLVRHDGDNGMHKEVKE